MAVRLLGLWKQRPFIKSSKPIEHNLADNCFILFWMRYTVSVFFPNVGRSFLIRIHVPWPEMETLKVNKVQNARQNVSLCPMCSMQAIVLSHRPTLRIYSSYTIYWTWIIYIQNPKTSFPIYRTRSLLFCHANLTINQSGKRSNSGCCSRAICMVSLPEEILKNFITTLARDPSQE